MTPERAAEEAKRAYLNAIEKVGSLLKATFEGESEPTLLDEALKSVAIARRAFLELENCLPEGPDLQKVREHHALILRKWEHACTMCSPN